MGVPASTQALPHGYQLGDYIIQRAVSEDAFGITYLAACGSEERVVSIREHLPVSIVRREAGRYRVQPVAGDLDGLTNAAWAMKCFLEEAEALRSIDHPALLKVEAVFQELGTAYYVQSMAEGVALDKWMETHGAPDKAPLQGMLTSLLSALQSIHGCQLPQGETLLHADLHPGSIIMQADDTPLLTQPGYARAAIAKRTGTPGTGAAGYSPFERLQPHGKTGPWSDLYALGAVFHHLITGCRPPDSIDRAEAEADPLPLLAAQAELTARYGKPLLAGIDKALQVKRSQRWQQAGEWLAALEAPTGEQTPTRRRKAILCILLPAILAAAALGCYLYSASPAGDGGKSVRPARPDTPVARAEEPAAADEAEPVINEEAVTDEAPNVRTITLEPGYTYVRHVIAPGETLASIAGKYNVTEEAILSTNKGCKRNALRPGLSLHIPIPDSPATDNPPAPALKFHEVRKGESLGRIAKEYNMPVTKLMGTSNKSPFFSASRACAREKACIPAAFRVK